MKISKKELKPSFNIAKTKEEINIKKEANKAEKKVAQDISKIMTINSGAKLFDPTDLRVKDSRVEIKTAITAKQIIVTEKMLDKLLKQSARVGKNPVLLLNFQNSKLNIKKWILTPLE